MAGGISAHGSLRLLSFVLSPQALRILDIRLIIKVRLLEGHVNEEALKAICFQPEKAAEQTENLYCSAGRAAGLELAPGLFPLLHSVLRGSRNCC